MVSDRTGSELEMHRIGQDGIGSDRMGVGNASDRTESDRIGVGNTPDRTGSIGSGSAKPPINGR